jgi:predicted patatin/cPLA2 family phospholipase
MDGGISAPIPVPEAYRRGARRILVIRSRPAEFAKRASVLGHLGALPFRKASAFARAVRQAHQAYRGAIAFMQSPPNDCEIVQVAPARKLATGRTTQHRQALEQDYALGRELGAHAIGRWWQSDTRVAARTVANSCS